MQGVHPKKQTEITEGFIKQRNKVKREAMSKSKKKTWFDVMYNRFNKNFGVKSLDLLECTG